MKTSLRKIRVTRPSAGVPSYPQPFKPSGTDGVPAKKRVLVVEDQSAVCDLVSEMVQSHPRCVAVGTASDGLSAIELALRLKPDILVLDVIMPGVGGIEILRRLGGSLPAMKVLVFSGKQEPHIVRALMQAGIHGFVNKNGPLSELRKALEALSPSEPLPARSQRGCAWIISATRSHTADWSSTTRTRFLASVVSRQGGFKVC